MINFIERPELKKYIQSYKQDTTIFVEGDKSQDLYILVSGKLGLYKGKKKISEINKPGSLFGEMSFLLRTCRSATVKANTDVRAIVIPASEISSFLEESPSIAPEITRLLAKRLFETTQVVHCYKEFCDQIPDSVIMTDKDLKILAWNTAAEKLYGRSWNQMRNKSISEIYESQAVFQQFMDELAVQKSVRERPLKIIHPLENWRFVSTSTNVLYDGRGNIDGYIFLGRDVTREHSIQEKAHRIRNSIMPAAAAIFVILFATMLWTLPDYMRGRELLQNRKQTFAERLAYDYPSLSLSLADLVASGNLADTTQLMEEYLNRKNASSFGIKGLVLLDTDKNVINAHTTHVNENTAQLLGSSYAELKFSGPENSIHKTISVVHDSRKSAGDKETELAFKLNKAGDFFGWLIFQLDMQYLQNEFGLKPGDLKSIRFVHS
jgi:PAS domain S-box-containing protein